MSRRAIVLFLSMAFVCAVVSTTRGYVGDMQRFKEWSRVAGFWRGGFRGLRRGLAGCALGGLLPLLPFLAAQRTDQLLALPWRIQGAMPYVTAGAHNFWWLATLGSNWERLFSYWLLWGPLRYQDVSALMLLGVTALAVWRVLKGSSLASAAAYLAFGWYMLTVQAHENHSFFVIPLLALSLHDGPAPRRALGVVSVTLLLNLGLHSAELWGPGYDFIYLPEPQRWLATLNAAANLALLFWWTRQLLSARSPARA